MFTRRTLLQAFALLPSTFAAAERTAIDRQRFRGLEQSIGGRLGVAFVNVGSGATGGYRAGERFPMCSTFKWLAVAALLARVDRGQERLDRRVAFGKDDLLSYAPVTTARVGEGSMPLADLCDAAITLSDNTAANLILAALDGPESVTKFARTIGDAVTRLDRNEPALNDVAPGDPRDTTTPSAMVGDMRRLLVGRALSPSSRDQLIGWLVASKTGAARLRAGFPTNWRIGDKTGTCERGTTNDVAIAWPPDRPPILVAAYLSDTTAADRLRESTLADVARLVAQAA